MVLVHAKDAMEPVTSESIVDARLQRGRLVAMLLTREFVADAVDFWSHHTESIKQQRFFIETQVGHVQPVSVRDAGVPAAITDVVDTRRH